MTLHGDLLTEFKQIRGVQTGNDDTRLTALLASAIGAVENMIGYKMAYPSAVITEKYTGDNTNKLVLKYKPIDSTKAMTLTIDDDTEDLTDANEYFVDYENATILKYAGVFASELMSVVVTYWGGYTSATIPEPLKLAIFMYGARMDDLFHRNILATGEYLLTFKNDEIERLTLPYRRIIL